MVTLRTYSNPAEAALAKSLLDDHKIFCSLADENVNLYGGGPLAMPIRLLVADDQAEEAARSLKTKEPELSRDFDPGIASEKPGQRKISTSKFCLGFANFIISANGCWFWSSSF
jgi:hypothetical protein